MTELRRVPSPLNFWSPALRHRPFSGSSLSTGGTPNIFPEFDVVKKGCLYVKRPPKSTSRSVIKINIKTWQKRHVVLRDACFPLDTTSLEIFDRDTPNDQGADSPSSPTPSVLSGHSLEVPPLVSTASPPHAPSVPGRLVIDLRMVTGVEDYLQSKRFANAFVINRSDGAPLIFGAESDLEKRCWQSAIRLLSDKVKNCSFPHSLPLRDQARRPSCPPRLGREVLAHQPRLTLLSLASVQDDRVTRQMATVSLRDHRIEHCNTSRSSANSLDELSTRSFTTCSSQSFKVFLPQRLPEPAPCESQVTTSTTSPVANTPSNDQKNSYIDIVDHVIKNSTVSTVIDVAPVVPKRPLRKMFSSSALIGPSQEPGQIRKLLFKDKRKDSGFSESFDETMTHDADSLIGGRLKECQSTSSELTHHSSRSSCQSSDFTPPLMPRHRQPSWDEPANGSAYIRVTDVMIQESTNEMTPALPPRRSLTNRKTDSPPRPPPRPAHTLLFQ